MGIGHRSAAAGRGPVGASSRCSAPLRCGRPGNPPRLRDAVLLWPQASSRLLADHAMQRCEGRGLVAGVTRYRYRQRPRVRYCVRDSADPVRLAHRLQCHSQSQTALRSPTCHDRRQVTLDVATSGFAGANRREYSSQHGARLSPRHLPVREMGGASARCAARSFR